MHSACRELWSAEWLYLVVIDAADRVRDANAAARRLLLLPDHGDLSTPRSLTPLAPLELGEGIDEAMQSIDVLTPAGLVRSFEFRINPAAVPEGGAAARAEGADGANSPAPGSRDGYLCIGVDITRRRRAEHRVATLFDESRDMLFTCGPDDRIREVNEAGAQMLGCPGAASLINRKITDFYVSLADRDYYRQRMESDGYVRDLEIVMRREDGTRLVVLDTSTAEKDADGAVVAYRGVLKDITDRIRLEQEHMKMNIELAEANRKLRHTQSRLVQQEKLASVGRLAAGVAHEINNPLSFVKSNLATLRDYSRRMTEYLYGSTAEDKLPSEVRYVLKDLSTLFEESEQGFQRMVSIVDGLRNFARTGTGMRELYNLNSAVDTTLTILRNEYKRDIRVERELGEIPDVSCVPDEINQVMLNILINAIHAVRETAEKGGAGAGAEQGAAENDRDGEQAGGTIRIRTGTADEFVYCRIQDSGPGIPPEHRPQVFEPFFTTKPHGRGTGLGLSISYDIVVNKHGGDLKMEHPQEGGVAFILTLPRNLARDAEY
jgi:PAS domain S-box-containing protein